MKRLLPNPTNRIDAEKKWALDHYYTIINRMNSIVERYNDYVYRSNIIESRLDKVSDRLTILDGQVNDQLDSITNYYAVYLRGGYGTSITMSRSDWNQLSSFYSKSISFWGGGIHSCIRVYLKSPKVHETRPIDDYSIFLTRDTYSEDWEGGFLVSYNELDSIYNKIGRPDPVELGIINHPSWGNGTNPGSGILIITGKSRISSGTFKSTHTVAGKYVKPSKVHTIVPYIDQSAVGKGNIVSVEDCIIGSNNIKKIGG